MNRFFSFLLIFSLLASHVRAESFQSPDILMDSKLSFDWSKVLVSRIRRLLKNYSVTDPFTMKFNEKIVLSDALLEEYLPDESKKLMDDLGQALGMNFLHTDIQVSMEGFSYDIQGFDVDLKSSGKDQSDLVIAADFSASKLHVNADKVTLAIKMQVAGSNKLPDINIEIIKPQVDANEDKLINFFAKVKIEDQKNQFFRLNVQDADFEKMASDLAEDPNKVDFTYSDIVIPTISVRANDKSVDFYAEKIRGIIEQNREGLKGLLVAQFSSMLKKGTGSSILKAIEKVDIAKEYWFSSSALQTEIKIVNFSSDPERNNLMLNLSGDFCTNQKFKSLAGDCLTAKTTALPSSRITPALHAESMEFMKSLMNSGEANVVASLSEDYVNKLLIGTLDGGLWDDLLKESGVVLGPKKVFIRLDEKGESGTLFMDIIYRPSKIKRLAMGVSHVQFPLVMKVSTRIEIRENIPAIIVRINDVDASDETLLKGRQDLGLVSSISHIPRFKQKVLQTIREDLALVKNKDVLDLRYPELKGASLEKVDFLSDGTGRMNAIMKAPR